MSKFNAATMEIPQEINKNAWLEWVDERRERGKKLTQRAAILCINLLKSYTQEVQAIIICTSIMNGWTGLFPPKQQVYQPPQEQVSFIEQHTNRSWADGL